MRTRGPNGPLVESALDGGPRCVRGVLARTPDGAWRICCDYRGLISRPAVEPLPHMDAPLDGKMIINNNNNNNEITFDPSRAWP